VKESFACGGKVDKFPQFGQVSDCCCIEDWEDDYQSFPWFWMVSFWGVWEDLVYLEQNQYRQNSLH
jgi:hypothetical protein